CRFNQHESACQCQHGAHGGTSARPYDAPRSSRLRDALGAAGLPSCLGPTTTETSSEAGRASTGDSPNTHTDAFDTELWPSSSCPAVHLPDRPSAKGVHKVAGPTHTPNSPPVVEHGQPVR